MSDDVSKQSWFPQWLSQEAANRLLTAQEAGPVEAPPITENLLCKVDRFGAATTLVSSP